MRIVFSGAGPMTVITARRLIEAGHEVIIIEVDGAKIEELSDELDCSFVQGDASKPNILSQVDPEDCDLLFCLADSDQVNIITALLGRSMGFKRVVPSIENVELQQLCSELKLEDTIIPVHTMSQYLEDMVAGLDNVQLSTILKNGARLFTFVAGKEDAAGADEFDLPEKTSFLFYYRNDDFFKAEKDTRFKKGDEIVVLTRKESLSELQDRWSPEQAENAD